MVAFWRPKAYFDMAAENHASHDQSENRKTGVQNSKKWYGDQNRCTKSQKRVYEIQKRTPEVK
jgi:hypothetical protein